MFLPILRKTTVWRACAGQGLSIRPPLTPIPLPRPTRAAVFYRSGGPELLGPSRGDVRPFPRRGTKADKYTSFSDVMYSSTVYDLSQLRQNGWYSTLTPNYISIPRKFPERSRNLLFRRRHLPLILFPMRYLCSLPLGGDAGLKAYYDGLITQLALSHHLFLLRPLVSVQGLPRNPLATRCAAVLYWRR